jgi:hypothetical protein
MAFQVSFNKMRGYGIGVFGWSASPLKDGTGNSSKRSMFNQHWCNP